MPLSGQPHGEIPLTPSVPMKIEKSIGVVLGEDSPAQCDGAGAQSRQATQLFQSWPWQMRNLKEGCRWYLCNIYHGLMCGIVF
jgi:hypothetical protein